MNNYKEIRLAHYESQSAVVARFIDGSNQSRRYPNVTRSSIKRLQNAIIKANLNIEFELRLPIGYNEVGWVADRKEGQ